MAIFNESMTFKWNAIFRPLKQANVEVSSVSRNQNIKPFYEKSLSQTPMNPSQPSKRPFKPSRKFLGFQWFELKCPIVL